MKHDLKLNSNKGMSLIEVMIVVTIMSLLTVGLSSVYSGIAEKQRLETAKSGLLEFSLNLQKVLSDEASWTTTINHVTNLANAGLSCLADATPNCLNNGTGANFNVYQQNGTAVFLGATATSGIDMTGGPCNTYGTANIACPFRFTLTALTQCLNGAANCVAPQVTIIGNLVIDPALINTDTVLRKIDNRALAIAPPPAVAPALPQSTISFRISRGQKTRYESFTLLNTVLAGVGGGSCLPLNSWIPRPLNLLLDKNNITTLVADVFRLPPGTYECTVSAQGYDQPSGFKVRLANLDTPANTYSVGSAVTQPNTSAIAFGKVKFQLHRTPNTRMQLQQYCITDASVPGTAMGVSIGVGPNNYTRVYCVRTF